MFIEARAVLIGAIDNLETLAAVLTREVEDYRSAQALNAESRACKEALLTIGVLVTKLRQVQAAQRANEMQMELRECTHCD